MASRSEPPFSSKPAGNEHDALGARVCDGVEQHRRRLRGAHGQHQEIHRLPKRRQSTGTARQPSMRSTPGLMTVIASRSNPSRSRFRRITCPGFMCSETPAMATLRGSSRRGILSSGRAGAGRAPRASVARASTATRRPSDTTNGFTSISRRPRAPSAAARRCMRSSTDWSDDHAQARTACCRRRRGDLRDRATCRPPTAIDSGGSVACTTPTLCNASRRDARNSAPAPPGEIVTMGPNSRVCWAAISSSCPSARSCGTNSATSRPVRSNPASRAHIAAAAARTSSRAHDRDAACHALVQERWRDGLHDEPRTVQLRQAVPPSAATDPSRTRAPGRRGRTPGAARSPRARTGRRARRLAHRATTARARSIHLARRRTL